jgi:hypothetical protein
MGTHRPSASFRWRWPALSGRWIAAGAVAAVLAGAAAVASGANGADSERGSFVRLPAAGDSPRAQAVKPAVETVAITGVGDVIMGSTPKLPPGNGRTFFDDVRPALHGDVVMGNLESALTDQTRSTKCTPTPTPSRTPPPTATASPAPNSCFAFRVPPGYARWLAGAGFTVLNLANNHARDYGSAGLADTRAALSSHGVASTGSAGQITMTKVRGVTVAILGFSPYAWTNSLLDVTGAADLVRRAARLADVVVVNMHVGAEGADHTHVRPGSETFLGENRGDPIRFAHAVVDAGADLIVGHSPHVLRGMEFYRGRLIAYSMGNFAGYRTLSSAGPMGVGGVLAVRLRADGTWAGGTLTGTHLVNRGLPALDPRREALTLVRRLSAADLAPRAVHISPTGVLSPV